MMCILGGCVDCGGSKWSSSASLRFARDSFSVSPWLAISTARHCETYQLASRQTVAANGRFMSRRPMRPDTARNLGSLHVLCQLEIVVRLEVDPKLGRRSEVASKAQGGIRGDGAPAPDNVVDPRYGDEEFGRQPVGGRTLRPRNADQRHCPVPARHHRGYRPALCSLLRNDAPVLDQPPIELRSRAGTRREGIRDFWPYPASSGGVT